METLIRLGWAVLPGLVVSVVMAVWNRRQRGRDAEADERDAKRVKGQAVQVSLLVAAAKLSYAVAMAMKRGAPNGEIEDGIEQYKEAMIAFKKFERELVAEKSADV
ncbi:MAG: hypothetical protein ACOYIE_05270 [Agathobaculum sp.]|jgi:hypothetical protein|uniref:hypothetical protein n=1 Tax=Agathobaculum sp. TaxID=2048138 RepID=UPI003D8A1CAD